MKQSIVFTDEARVKMTGKDIVKLHKEASTKLRDRASDTNVSGHLKGNFFYRIVKNAIFIF